MDIEMSIRKWIISIFKGINLQDCRMWSRFWSFTLWRRELMPLSVDQNEAQEVELVVQRPNGWWFHSHSLFDCVVSLGKTLDARLLPMEQAVPCMAAANPLVYESVCKSVNCEVLWDTAIENARKVLNKYIFHSSSWIESLVKGKITLFTSSWPCTYTDVQMDFKTRVSEKLKSFLDQYRHKHI